ncbi:MAG: hypothetical protein ABSB74_19330 [Tepidisphaeraceae bacterium]
MSEQPETIKCSSCGNVFFTIGRSPDGKPTYTAVKPGVVDAVEGEQEIYRIICPLCQHAEEVSGTVLPFEKLKLLHEIPDPWKFVEASRIDRSYQGTTRSISDDTIRDIAANFVKSIDRLVAIAEIAPLSTGLSGLYQNHFRTTGERGILPVEKSEQAWNDAMDRNVANAQLFTSPLAPEIRAIALEIGYSELRNWTRQHGEMNPGVEAILMAQIVLAWTAFESLSADLWVAAVNVRPNPLATRAGAPSGGKGQPKSLTIPQMSEYAHNFDLSKVMGDVLKNEKKVDFVSLASTSAAYEMAFDTPLALFGDDQLRLLELVRNLIVHDGGTVGQKFIDDLEIAKLTGHRDCAGVVKDKPFPLNGEMTSRFVESATCSGKTLITFVDKYLQQEPLKNSS